VSSPTAAIDPVLPKIRAEAARRRTFAIISHPDAGKTTLTEKLLLYGGAIRLAGSIRSRGAGRHATSDWMAIERERGISVTTSVLHFEFGGLRANLLDTPGHDDFSEDTYRTLAAADCAVMLIDAAKGVEPQTIKLFQACRLRHLPIVTFVNKLDRHGRDPLELLDEIEDVLGIPSTAASWPIGSGDRFRGVYDRWSREILLFDRSASRERATHATVLAADEAALRDALPGEAGDGLVHDLELLDAAGSSFDRELFLAGRQTPVFFGSALTNFGVERFLERFVELCPAPGPYATVEGSPPADRFSGFVFKIQANLDPLHRDRLAFVRVCSGRFERGMRILHERTGRPIPTARASRLQSREREIVEEAYPGDILGLWDPGVLRIGDTLHEGAPVRYAGIPRFSPEHFARVRLRDPFRRKQLQKGLEELAEEGAVQLFFDPARREPDPILGAVGLLQFDVVKHRLASEYGVDAALERLSYRLARWPAGTADPEEIERRLERSCFVDSEGRPVLLFKDDFDLRWVLDKTRGLELSATAEPLRTVRPAAAK
jgi:peptide chain release factor 3